MKIIIDCFGGDHSPEANVGGALAALPLFPDLTLVLTGDREKITKCLEGGKYDTSRIEIIDAPEIIDCHDKPTDAIRQKKESSMMKGIKLLCDDEAGEYAGMVSCGSTGALVAAATLRVGRIRGVIRPAFCPILPTMAGGVVGICDSGANTDITPDYLAQYAYMGSLYLSRAMNISSPRVALLNIGEEKEKGDTLHKEAFELISALENVNFIGNIESREVLSGKADLVVCDGFSGNVLIKSIEGTSLGLLKKLKTDIMSKTKYKLGALLMKQMFADEKNFMDYRNYGGSVLLGCRKTIVKGHGSSNDAAVCKCIEQVYNAEKGHLTEEIEAAVSADIKE